MQLGTRIKELCESKKLLQRQLSTKLEINIPVYSKIERGERIAKREQFVIVVENSIYTCFDSGIDEDFAKAIAKDKPLRIVFKKSGFKNDTAKVNVKQLLKQLSPETKMKVI